MTVTVGITEVQDASACTTRDCLPAAVLAGLPVAIVYLLFQRRVTQAIMLSPASRASVTAHTDVPAWVPGVGGAGQLGSSVGRCDPICPAILAFHKWLVSRMNPT